MTTTAEDTAEAFDDDPRPARFEAAPVRYRGTYIEMLVSSLIGLVASLVLSIEALALAENPFADLNCDINAVLSCGTVGASWQASLLGFPNAYLGLIAEPVVITIAVAALGGVRFPRWFMLSAQVVYFIGFAFAYWLFYQSFFVIGALCPWCLTITVTTTLGVREHDAREPAREQLQAVRRRLPDGGQLASRRRRHPWGHPDLRDPHRHDPGQVRHCAVRLISRR